MWNSHSPIQHYTIEGQKADTKTICIYEHSLVDGDGWRDGYWVNSPLDHLYCCKGQQICIFKFLNMGTQFRKWIWNRPPLNHYYPIKGQQAYIIIIQEEKQEIFSSSHSKTPVPH